MEKEVIGKEKCFGRYFLDKFDNTKFTINVILILSFIFLIIIIVISALKKWIDSEIVMNIVIMLIGLIMGAILSRKNGS